mgnify:FL=1
MPFLYTFAQIIHFEIISKLFYDGCETDADQLFYKQKVYIMNKKNYQRPEITVLEAVGMPAILAGSGPENPKNGSEDVPGGDAVGGIGAGLGSQDGSSDPIDLENGGGDTGFELGW